MDGVTHQQRIADEAAATAWCSGLGKAILRQVAIEGKCGTQLTVVWWIWRCSSRALWSSDTSSGLVVFGWRVSGVSLVL